METTIAYLAGAIDSDGYIGMRKIKGPVYIERIGLKQVTPQIPLLLQEVFGGTVCTEAPSLPNGKLMHSWEVSHRKAAQAAAILLPHLRIKTEQARTLIELRQSKSRPRSETHVHKEAAPSRNRHGVVLIRRLVVSPETLAERDALYQRIRSLNSIGM